jgi:hypothetical protein
VSAYYHVRSRQTCFQKKKKIRKRKEKEKEKEKEKRKMRGMVYARMEGERQGHSSPETQTLETYL